MKDEFIPVACPDIGELEERYVAEAVRSGWVSSIGPFVDRFETEFSSFCEVKHGVAVSNGTDALSVTLQALGVGRGDEVIVPSLTFAAVPAAVVHAGAEPVFVDVTRDYWCIDPDLVERAVSDRVRAMIPVHSYGHPADMDRLLEIASARDIPVVEDCAEAHGATCGGRPVGSMGTAGCFSFYGNKVITTGEGGMVVTRDPELADRIRFLKDHAMDAERRYYHTEVGHNCRITNLQAALGCAQMQRIHEFLDRREEILAFYRTTLGDDHRLVLNPHMPWCRPVNWMVSAVLSEGHGDRRDDILAELRARSVDSRPFFVPCHELPPYRGFRAVGHEVDGCRVAEDLSRRGFNLPTSTTLDSDQLSRVTEALDGALDSVLG